MAFEFNLITEPWIPCLRQDGSIVTLGLLETLGQAHELREIHDDSPLVTVSVHRLLLAILHHIFGPPDSTAWAQLWANGQGSFDRAKLQDYFQQPSRWSRFDLFHPEHPFLQSPNLAYSIPDPKGKKDKVYAATIARLATDRASGNNATLFDHSVDAEPVEVSAAEAARLLVAAQAFSLGGRITAENADEGSADASPLCRAAVILIEGENLFQTLLYNLVAYDGTIQVASRSDPNHDRPAWDRPPLKAAGDRMPNGYLDWLTWQSRRIRLWPEANAAGQPVVRSVVLMMGEQFPEGFQRKQIETMCAFRKNPGAKGTDPWLALEFSAERVVWRNSMALFEAVDQVSDPPATLEWLATLESERRIPARTVYPLSLRGLVSDQATPIFWRHERIDLPLSLLNSPELQDVVRYALGIAEHAQRNLTRGLREFARYLLVSDSARQPGTTTKKEIEALAKNFGAERNFWAQAEIVFYRLLRDLGAVPTNSPEQQDTECDRLRAQWLQQVRDLSREVFEHILQHEAGSARILRARVVAENVFGRFDYQLGHPR